MTGDSEPASFTGAVNEIPSRINSVFEVGGRAVVKVAGPRFRRKMRIYDPKKMLRHEGDCLRALERFDVAPRVMFQQPGVLCMSWCGPTIDSVTVPDDWLLQVGRISEAFRMCELVHFDLKPKNVVCDGGTIRVIDFGWSMLGQKGFRPKGRREHQSFVGFGACSKETTESQLIRIIENVV